MPKRIVMIEDNKLEYIQDGLLLWLDGRDAPVNGAWIDRITKAQCAISGDVTYNSLNKCYSSGDANTQQIALPSLLSGSNNYTVQIVMLLRKEGGSIISFRAHPNAYKAQFYIWTSTPLKLLYAAGKIAQTGDAIDASLNTIMSISGSKNGTSTLSFGSGVFKTGNWSNTVVSTGCWLFRDDEGYRGYGNIYSVHVYNRQLTREEVLYNYEIDKKLFGAI